MNVDTHSPALAHYVWFDDDRHRYLRIGPLAWLVRIGDSWERCLDCREYEEAWQARAS